MRYYPLPDVKTSIDFVGEALAQRPSASYSWQPDLEIVPEETGEDGENKN
jgi:hypothetical protein